MKKIKSQWKQLTRQILALGLAVVLVSGMTDFSVLAEAAQKTTAASEENVTEKTAENPIAENTEVETVSGDTVSAEPKVQTTANSADDEAGIAVQADDGTTSDLIEVTIDGKAQNYTTFTEAMNAVTEALKSREPSIKIKLLANVESVGTVSFEPYYINQNANITVDLNGYTLGSKPEWSSQRKYMRFTYCNVTLEDNSSNLKGRSYMYFCIDNEDSTVTVKSGTYDLVGISYGGKGYFQGGYVGTIEVSGDKASCKITSGEYGRISISDASTLEILGENITVNNLSVSTNTTATVTGGTYKAIYGDLSNIVKKPYVLISTNENTAEEILNISGKESARNVRVAQVAGDRTAPIWTADDDSDEEYGIKIKDTWYNTLLSAVNFEDHIYNDTELQCTIRAKDTDVKKICYYTQVVEAYMLKNFTPLSSARLDELRDDGKFTSVETGGKDAITASLKMKYSNSYMIVLYACAVDQIGNRSEYICTNGILIDNKNPTIVIDEDKTKVSSTQITVSLNMSEDATLVYFYYDEYTAKNAGYEGISELDTVVESYIEAGYKEYINDLGIFKPFIKEQNGKWVPAVSDGGKVAITTDNKVEVPLHVAEVKEGENQITISGLMPYTMTRIIIQAMDKAGNPYVTGYSYFQHVYIITDKLTPQIVTEPSVTGVYGDEPSELTITGGKVSYDGKEIAGTWKITEDSSTRFEIGTNLKCAVTFTPADTQYEAVATQVVPTIAKRPITITIQNAELTKTYGDELSAITADDFVISGGKLAFADTAETIVKSLSYVTDAADATADAGTYDFTVKSDSQNYDITVEYPGGATHGTVEVQQAQGVIETTDKFQKDVTVTFGDPEFSISDWVRANHSETAISYAVENAKNRRNRDDEIITVTPDGIVEIHNAGTATIRISLPESTNYKKSDICINVTVEPKSITLEPIVKNYLYTKGGYDEVTVKSVLPEGFGSIEDVTCSYAKCSVSGKEGFLSESPSIGYAGGGYPVEIKYNVNPGQIDDKAQIGWNLDTNNYIINTNNVITIQLVLVDRKVVKLQEEKVNLLNTLTYGQALSELKFGNNTFIDPDTGKVVPGTLEWSNLDTIPDAGSHQVEWKFTPADTDTYMECTGTVSITVNKADPSEVTAPVFKLYYYRPTRLSENPHLLTSSTYVKQPGVVKDINGKELEGTWSWVEPNLVPEVGKQTLKVRFTPTDQNYNPVESSVALEVSKAYLDIKDSTKPSVPNAYTHGDYLYSQDPQNGMAGYYNYLGIFQPVEGTFSWYEEPNVQLSYLENKNHNKTYKVMFIPKEQDHYYEQMTRITIVVKQAEYPSNKPGDLNVKNSCKTLKDVELKLPEGWKFVVDDPSKLEEELGIGTENSINVKVQYQGEDKENYKNTETTITITRSACDHEKTERRDVVKATCMTEGNTGYLWCLICNSKLEDGTVTPKDPTNHTALTSKVIKQPTTSEEGIMEYTCSDCGYKATKAIAKIASSSSGSDDDDDDDDPAPTPTPAPTATPAPAVTPVRPNRTPVKPTVKEESKTPAPFLRGENGKEGWDIITEAVTEAAEGNTVVVDMNGSTVVPGDVFDRIRGKDITVEFDLGNGILWKVNGQSVEKGNVGDIDFTVRTGDDANDTIPVEIINNLTGERTYMNLSLAYEGEFGFEAILSLNVGAANAGLYANLFYYNESTKELEYLCTGEIGQDGGAELTFTHASEYTIVIDEQPMGETKETPEIAPVDDNKEDDTIVSVVPETEDSNIAVWVILGIIIAVAFIVISVIVAAKRNKEEEE